MNEISTITLIGFILIFSGILVLILGSLLFLMSEKSGEKIEEKNIRGGAIIFIGPIPIAFGSDKNTLLFLSLVMIILMFLSYFLFFYHKFKF